MCIKGTEGLIADELLFDLAERAMDSANGEAIHNHRVGNIDCGIVECRFYGGIAHYRVIQRGEGGVFVLAEGVDKVRDYVRITETVWAGSLAKAQYDFTTAWTEFKASLWAEVGRVLDPVVEKLAWLLRAGRHG